MKVAESYVQRLLRSDDPRRAIADLAAIWSARPGRSESQACFGLAEAEFNVHLYLAYTGEVINGGHAQFFSNRFGGYTEETLAALRAIGLHALSDILAEASCVFRGLSALRDEDYREAVLENLNTFQLRTLQKADFAFGNSFSAVDEACLVYLRQHNAEILQPERAA